MIKFFSTALMLFALASPAMSGSLTNHYSSYYAFGDSLTDDGKLEGLLLPPSLEGRFSNGPTYAEYIEDLFIGAGLDTGNLALGGATAGDINLRPFGPLSTFGGQVDTFVNALDTNTGLPTKLLTGESMPDGPNPGSKALVSVLFGANDIFQGFDPIAAADSVAVGIREIGGIGSGEFNDFFVPNLPTGLDEAFAANALLFNDRLAENIVQLRSEDFYIVEFVTGSVFDEILADIIGNGGAEYGVTQILPPCREGFTTPGPSCLDDGIDPDTILFNDGVHPNGVAQGLFGERSIAALEAATIPTVGTLPLMLGVLVVFAISRKRRADKPLQLATVS